MKPSPGPWRWDKNPYDFDCSDLEDANGKEVAGNPGEGGWGIAIGNPDDRALIALAPEMREMLMGLEWVDDDDIPRCPMCGASREDTGWNFEEQKPLPPRHDDKCPLVALLEKLR